MRKVLLTIFYSSIILFTACDDFLDITPTGMVIATTGEEYRKLLTYEYKNMPSDRGLATLRSDEMLLDKSSTTAEDYDSFFDIWIWNDDAPQPTTTSFGWRRYYHTIYIANYLLEHKDKITEVTSLERQQLIGEAYMFRAYMHFLLANLYAEPYTACIPEETRGVPLQLKADVNEVSGSSTLAKVYEQIVSDINEAKKNLNVEKWAEGQTYRFTKVSADALLARVLLYMGDWSGASKAAQDVLAYNSQLEDMTKSSSLFPNSYKSVESILALENIMTPTYFGIGRPSVSLLSIYKSGDMRKSKYYKQITASKSTLLKGGSDELRCSFRTGEMYLIVAECEAMQGHTSVAADSLIHLMKYRYSSTYYTRYADAVKAMTNEALIEEIHNERARELAFEGHRWFDLRRTNRPLMNKLYDGEEYQLDTDDARYTLRFPSDAIAANPEIQTIIKTNK